MKLVVGVSGGIDSVVLLKKFVEENSREIIVAHVDHGIRKESAADATFVRSLAKAYGLAYEQTELHLGPAASEEEARTKRYEWLNQIRDQYRADAIATAHHQDDVIETIIINLLRGTGWRGICSLREHDRLVRPLLNLSKAEIVQYALSNELEWREDSTNDDVRYLRNFVRYRYTQKMNADTRREWIELYDKQRALLGQIEQEIDEVTPLYGETNGVSRYQLIMSGREVFGEVIQKVVAAPLERSIIDQLWHFVCTGRPEKRFHQAGVDFRVTARDLIVSTSDIC